MKQTAHNTAHPTPQNKMANRKSIRDRKLTAMGISPQAAKIGQRMQEACKEPKQAKMFMLTNHGNGEYSLVEILSGRLEVIK